ncbi:MAG: response regulator [Gammaproteobacteria bacterium]|nr:response regulator [Gammaproteobacteria bacterium]
MKITSRPILLVEDDDVDAMAVYRAFKALHITNRLDRTENGERALAYLHGKLQDLPCLVLLDINMPIMGGIEFLRAVKDNAYVLRHIPIVVLTTSSEQQDKMESFNLGVAGYMKKPVDYQQFVETVRTIDRYWTVSEMPE